MSLKATSIVWEHSQHSGSALLVMLAIADFANDDGEAYPGMERLARKGRTTVRNLHKILRKLVDSGELEIDHKLGKPTSSGQRTNLYKIQLDCLLNGDQTYQSSLRKEVNRSSSLENKEVNSRASLEVNGGTGLEVNGGTGLEVEEVNPGTPKQSLKEEQSEEQSEESTTTADAGRRRSNPFDLFETEIGKLSPMVAEELKDFVEEFGDERVCESIRIAVVENKRSLSYMKGIFNNWRKSGITKKVEGENGTAKSDAANKFKESKYASFYANS